MAIAPWLGIALSFLGALALSLFHVSLSAHSKISLSRFLEDRSKDDRARVLARFEEIKIAVEVWRTVFLIAFLAYVLIIFPRIRLWPLWLFLAVIAIDFVFFEAVPRFLVASAEDRLLELFLPSYGLFLVLSAPVLAVFRWSYARGLREREHEEEREASDEEIETFIDEAKEEGIIERDESELLRSVVEFGDIVVREIMTPRVDMVCLRKDATIQKLRNLIVTEKYSRIPIYKDRVDNIEGIVIAKDLLSFSDEKYGAETFEPLIRPVIFVTESMKISELLNEFQRVKQKMAIVVDEHGGVSGLVTMEDLVEEIVGEIHDEYDSEEPKIMEIAPGEFLVSGDIKVGELEGLLGLELADEDFVTASGLVTFRLGHLPKKGEIIDVKGLAIEVVDVDQRRIQKLRIKAPVLPIKG
jgi:CBS domain containing-hemolysin-like protein